MAGMPLERTSPASLMEEVALPLQPATQPRGTFRQTCSDILWWIKACLKIGFASSLVIGLLVAYGLRFSVITVGPFTLGLYGVIIFADFITQFSCAVLNRWKAVRITKKYEQARSSPLDISVAVVGYREDSEAWKKCLESLQKQDAPPRAIIGVVDGQDGPDQDMANDFRAAFPEGTVLMADLPELLCKIYTRTYWEAIPEGFHSKTWSAKAARLKRSIGNVRLPCELAAEKLAWAAVYNRLDEWNELHAIDQYSAICLTQPHGHKRTAMFTAFSIALYIYKIRDAVFTTDSDTLLDSKALRYMSYILADDPNLGAVTGDVKIWNKNESVLALMCALRYWFAFNIERACQSWWRCVTCISGPIGLYRTSDMQVILGPWVLQQFLGRDCTFGDDRHLSNRLLGEGRHTAYTHLAYCESDSPAGFIRWVKQQTRWSKSFFREAFWFPKSFAIQSTWLSVETLKQTLYPFILTATVFQFIYAPTSLLRPAFWLGTLFGVALVKSTLAFIITGEAILLLFSFYGIFYFFGLLPSKIYALLTINVTAWGTSARSAAERGRTEGFGSRHQHVVHLIVWFTSLSAGFVIFFRHHFTAQPLIWTLPVLVPMSAACGWLYWDIIKADIVYFSSRAAQRVKAVFIPQEKVQLTVEAKGESDLEKGLSQEPPRATIASSMPAQLPPFPHEDGQRRALRKRVSTASDDSFPSSASSQVNWQAPSHGSEQDPFIDGSSSETEPAAETLGAHASVPIQRNGKKGSLQARRDEAASRRNDKPLSVAIPSPALSRTRSRDTYSGSDSEPESPFTSSPLRDRHARGRLAAEDHRELESMPPLPSPLPSPFRSATSYTVVQVPSPTRSRFSPSEPSSPTKVGTQSLIPLSTSSKDPLRRHKTLSSFSSRESFQCSDALHSAGARPMLQRQGCSTISRDSSQTLVAAPEPAGGCSAGAPSLKKPQLRERTSSLTLVDGDRDAGFAKERSTLSPWAQVPSYADLTPATTKPEFTLVPVDQSLKVPENPARGRESLMDVKEEDEGGHAQSAFIAAARLRNMPV